MNSTLEKFAYPQSLIQSYEHWSVLLRPQQTTLGSLILGAHSDTAFAFSDLPPTAFSELDTIIPAIERTLTRCFNYDKINYLMLMMVDPHVHFHVLPRYAEPVKYRGVEYIDHGWPGPPQLSTDNLIEEDQRIELLSYIRADWGVLE